MAQFDTNLMRPVQMDGFAEAFKEGVKTREQNMAKAAYAELIRNPDNDKALEALGRVAPQVAGEIMEKRREKAKAALGEYQGTITKAAQMAQRMKAENPGMSDEQIFMNVRTGLNQLQMPGADKIPAQFEPVYWKNILSLADPEKDTTPSAIREYDIAVQRKLVPEGTTFVQYQQMMNPGMLAPVTLGPNDVVTTPGATPAPAPGTIVADPRLQGGQSGAPAGGFPGQ